MYDNAKRSLWAEQVVARLPAAFPVLADIGVNVLTTVSYPPSGARGRLDKIQPASFDMQWRGNDNEKDGFLAIHPIAWTDSMSAARAMLWGLARSVKGARHGATSVGLRKESNATISATPETDAILQAIIAEVGEMPEGSGVPFPARETKRGRMVRYECGCAKFYATNGNIHARCEDCGQPFNHP